MKSISHIPKGNIRFRLKIKADSATVCISSSIRFLSPSQVLSSFSPSASLQQTSILCLFFFNSTGSYSRLWQKTNNCSSDIFIFIFIMKSKKWGRPSSRTTVGHLGIQKKGLQRGSCFHITSFIHAMLYWNKKKKKKLAKA